MKFAAFIFALITSLVLYMTISQSGITNPSTQSEPIVENPFLNVIKQLEKENEIDLEFYKKVKKTINYDTVDIPVINNFSAPYDVLVVGDSSILMGVSSNVVNQVAGKNVGFFSFPAMKLNMELLHFISFFRENYMTKNPQIILAFDPKFLLVNADDIQEHEGLGSLIREPERGFRPTSFCLFCVSAKSNNTWQSKVLKIRERWSKLNSTPAFLPASIKCCLLCFNWVASKPYFSDRCSSMACPCLGI